MRFQRLFVPLVLASVAVSGALAQSNLPRNSYLDKRVNGVAELVRQVQSDPIVMDRYRRHFAMTSDEVESYFSSLRVGVLNKDGVYTVYGVPHTSGDFHAHLRLLKKGEPVFMESDGTPVLMLVCGNPLILGPKKPVTPNRVMTRTGPTEGMREITADVAPMPSAGMPAPETPVVGAPVQPLYPAPSSNQNVLPLLLGLAGSIGFSHGHGPPPVPEPVSIVVLAGGIAAIAARRRMKKSPVDSKTLDSKGPLRSA
ncbi:MAG: hypothetical protein ACHQ50_15995 [Fimbriimonadales bacterium]